MTNKKKRQRGSRTHGGGSHKNGRGAGHRGGRGRAGRSKHEHHNYDPIGKHGFTRPESATDEVLEIRVQKLDEDAALYAAEGLAEQANGGYHLDAREVVDDGFDVDAVKVLGGGQVRQQLTITADAFTGGARELIADAGGDAVLSDRAEPAPDESTEEAEEISDEESDEE
ncbi:MAG: LSU ribosomal protein L15P [uncultured archaeon A07HR60]|nr:MAG: LSU ribosomal protein L15P [uncultured archaeon A07HR60]